MTPSKKELLQRIEGALLHEDSRMQMKAVGTALVRIMQNQTEDEIQAGSTHHANGKGFTGAHAEIGTSMAQFFLRNGYLTPRQMKFWTDPMGKMDRPRILIYKKQLLEFAKKKAEIA